MFLTCLSNFLSQKTFPIIDRFRIREWGLGDFLGRNSSAREENFLGKQLGLHLFGYLLQANIMSPENNRKNFFKKFLQEE